MSNDRWIQSTLGDSCEMYQPETITGKQLIADGAYPVYGANGVIGRYDKFNHAEPQLLITCRGATCGSVNVSVSNAWITGNAMVVRPKNGDLTLRFLEYLFRGGIDISQAITGAAQPQITRTNLNPIPISFPASLAEQRRIVGIIDEAFAAIATAKANTEKNLRNARELFESELQAVFTERGDGWTDEPLGEIAEFKNGLNFSQSSKGQSVRVVGVGNFGENYIVPLADLQSVTIDDELDENYEIREHDLLTVRSNGSNDLVGRCMLVPAIDETISYSGFVIRIRPNTSVIVPQFLLQFMKCSDTRDRLTRGGGGANISNINQGKLSALSVPLPPPNAQRAIVRKIDRLREETQRLASLYHQKLNALDALKKSLLHQAFSGQLGGSVQDLQTVSEVGV